MTKGKEESIVTVLNHGSYKGIPSVTAGTDKGHRVYSLYKNGKWANSGHYDRTVRYLEKI